MRDIALEDRKINYERKAIGENLVVCYLVYRHDRDEGKGHEDLESVHLSVEESMDEADSLAREETRERTSYIVYEYNIGPGGDIAPRVVHYGDAEA